MNERADEKQRFRILLPVWGKHYIDIALEFCIPALLAPNNIPVIAEDAECEFVFLTKTADVQYIETAAASRELAHYCKVRFIEIDDLIIPGHEGLTLTYAYARGIHAAGQEMTDIRFIFINADFIFSNGVLKTVTDHAKKGSSAILAPSLRCVSEEAIEELRRAEKEDVAVAFEPRRLVSLALKRLHPTAMANVVNQSLASHAAPYQFFWRHGEDALLGRFYLLFMLSIKPERVMNDVPGFCDYSFAQEMCPSGKVTVIEDSDDGFILELQSRQHEQEYIHLNRPKVSAAANHLSEWTTALHRQNAERTMVFHAGDWRSTPAIMATIETFMATLKKLMSARPMPHRNHPYWQKNVARVATATPPVADTFDKSEKLTTGNTSLFSRVYRLFRRMAGTPPFVTPIHYDWNNYRHFERQIEHCRPQAAQSCLAISDDPVVLGQILAYSSGLWTHRPLYGVLTSEDAMSCDLMVCYLRRRSDAEPQYVAKIRSCTTAAAHMLKPRGRLVVMMHDTSQSFPPVPLARIILSYLHEPLPPGLHVETTAIAGSSFHVWLRKRLTQRASRLSQYRGGFLVFNGLLTGILLVCVLLANIYERLFTRPSRVTQFCSSLTFTTVRIDANTPDHSRNA